MTPINFLIGDRLFPLKGKNLVSYSNLFTSHSFDRMSSYGRITMNIESVMRYNNFNMFDFYRLLNNFFLPRGARYLIVELFL